MRIESPYGKDPLTELQETYKINSFEQLFDQLSELLSVQYDLELDDILAVNFGHALTIQFTAGESTCFLKMESSLINATPTALFLLLDQWRSAGIPVPSILSRKDGSPYGPLLENTNYDIEYVMVQLDGEQLTSRAQRALETFIEMMIKLHQVGKDHEPHVLGGDAAKNSLRSRIQDRLDGITQEILSFDDVIEEGALSNVKAMAKWVKERADDLDDPLERTHIHGDLRFSHVLYDSLNQVSGLIDIDEACYGERLVDIVYSVISAPRHSDGFWLDWDDQKLLIQMYSAAEPLTDAEIAFLPVALVFANLEQIANLLRYWEYGDFDDLPKIHRNIELLDTIRRENFMALLR